MRRNGSSSPMWRAIRGVAIAVAVLAPGLAGGTPAAGAVTGLWGVVACQNPDGSSAPSEGWTASTSAPSGGAPIASTQCQSDVPMKAILSELAPAPDGTHATLTFTAPSGSGIEGGSVNASLYAGGFNGFNAAANAELAAAGLSSGDAFVDCNVFVPTASCNHTDQVSGTFTIPSTPGPLYADASCVAHPNDPCNSGGGGDNAWADVEIYWAHVILHTGESPQATNFSGSAQAPRVSGTAHLVFTASASGPGVHDAVVEIDRQPVWQSAPSETTCNSVGTDAASGAPLYDSVQPCSNTETIDASVPTTGLPDGPHELAVVVHDAAGNASTVYDQNIVTSNPQTTPAPRRGVVHARFTIHWTWNAYGTTLDHIAVKQLPRTARVAVRCVHRGGPRLHLHAARARRVGRLLRELDGAHFAAGNVLYLTVTAPHQRAERIRLTIRAGLIPLARLIR